MLFLGPPSDAQLARYPDLQGIGVASTARAQSPAWMDAELPGAFARLAALNPELMQYKVCSTLDSAPDMGSFGRAIEIGAAQFGPAVVPILVAAPQMRRYQAFGQLFVGFEGEVYRLDRHPVMSRHPVTPMAEADVARHIALQSESLDVQCLSLEDVSRSVSLPQSAPGPGRIAAITLDCIDDRSECAAGRLIWETRAANRFVVGSQGVGPTGRVVVVSGSVSPTTAGQIAWAKENGFAGIPFDATRACGTDAELEREVASCLHASLAAMDQGQDKLIYTAKGLDAASVQRFRQAVAGSTWSLVDANQRVGKALGRILRQTLERSPTRRVVVSGGDTSGHATQELGIFALSALAPTIPGAALFRAHADGPMDGLEVALKGGQMGSRDCFGWIRSGGGTR